MDNDVIRSVLGALMSGTALAAAITAPTSAHAQATADTTATQGLGEIVVTASRREERLQNVPVAVTALSGDDLRLKQVVNLTAIAENTPSLNINKVQGDNTAVTLFMRGLGSTDVTITTDPAVGVYLDGVYIARAPGGNLEMVDVGRAEVLRGPQGTLFGRNTIGGAINIVPNKPTDNWEGSLSASYGNYETVRLVGVVNAPLSSALALRVAASHSNQAGFVYDTKTGRDLGGVRSDFIRAQLQAKLSDSWTVLLGYDHTNNKSFGQRSSPIAFYATGLSLIPDAEEPLYQNPYRRGLSPNLAGPFTGNVSGVSGVVTGELGDVTVKSITAYRTTAKNYRDVDYDGTPYNLIGATVGYSNEKQYSEELQIFGKALNGSLDWIIGGFWFKEDGEDATVGINGLGLNLLPSQKVGLTLQGGHNKSLGAYAQLTYAITDQLRITGGVRYTKDTRGGNQRNATVTLGDLATPVACPVAGAVLPTCTTILPPVNFRFVPFTLGVDYKPNDGMMFYGKFSRGFRAGGYSTRGTIPAVFKVPYRPERVDSYEAGFKLDLLDKHLRLNAAVYHAVYSDIQFSVIVPDPTGFQPAGISSVANAGQARINGVELEGTAVLGPLRLNANFSVTDPKYTRIDPTAAKTGITLDTTFPFFSRYAWGVGATYIAETPVGALTLNADYSHKSRIYWAPIPPSSINAFSPGYGVANAQASFALKSIPLTVSAYVRNLANQKYMARGLFNPGLVTMGFPGDPRTYGVGVRYAF